MFLVRLTKSLIGIVWFILLTSASQACAQTAPLQTSSVETQQRLAYELFKAQSDNSDKVETLLKTNAPHLSETFWREFVDEASRSFSLGQHTRAFVLYDIARKISIELNNPRLLARTLYYVGRSYSSLNQFDQAKAAYLESRTALLNSGLHRDLSYILSDLATISFIQENYVEARSFAEESLKLSDTQVAGSSQRLEPSEAAGRAGALSTLGELSAREGNYSEAIDLLQRSLSLYENLSDGTPTNEYYIVDLYASLGRVFTSAGDSKKALAFLNKALTISNGLNYPEQRASLLNSIGFLYLEQEDYGLARVQFDESLRIYRNTKNDREQSRVLLNLGVVAQRERNHEIAISYFSKSLELAKLNNNLDVELAATEGLGVALTGKRDFTAAKNILGATLVRIKEVKDKIREVELLWRLAELYYEMGNYEESSELGETAVEKARALHSPKLIYLAATTLGDSYAAQNRVDLAVSTLNQAIEQSELLRDGVAGGEVQSQIFFEKRVNAYHSLVDLLVKMKRPLDALLIAERAKGRVLLDVMKGGRSSLSGALTASEQAEERELNKKVSAINDRINAQSNSDPRALNDLYEDLDAARLRLQLFQNALYTSHPTLKTKTGRTENLTERDLNRLLVHENVSYLEYVVTEKRVYLFVLGPKRMNDVGDIKVYEIGTDQASLSTQVEQFHRRLANRHPDFKGLANELYQILLGPTKNEVSNVEALCIIPDGFLWNVPFQALVSTSNKYLIEERDLYYAPSLNVLNEMKKAGEAHDKRPVSILALGNPVIGRDEQRNEELCPLPEATTEVNSIAKTFLGTKRKVLVGRDASEQTFRALAPSYSTIHLATHGVLDNRQPLYSHLLLTKTEGDTENDGLLEAREIMNMNLRANLAVLSACETANGRISSGEGVMGMSWAFFVAGARSMLVSNWKVDSASTSKLMVSFYQQFSSKRGFSKTNKSVALREASLKLMKDSRYRHPFYWASFVLLGNPD